MGIRDRVKALGSKAVSRGIDLVAKKLYGNQQPEWSEEERAGGVILSGDSSTASDEATRLARQAGYQVVDRPEPSLGLTRPKAGRTFGARFDHYPILSPDGVLPPKGSEAVWDLNAQLLEPIRTGLAEWKEVLLLAFTAIDSPESDTLEDQLLELHPVVEPQCVVVFARLGNLEQDRLYRRVKVGTVTLVLPHVPMLFVFHIGRDGTLTWRSLAHGKLDASAARFGMVPLIDGRTYVPEGATGVLEMVTGKTRHRSSAADGYPRKFSTKLELDGGTGAGEGVSNGGGGDGQAG